MVTSTNDSGAGSLRQAVQNANALPGRDEIHFDIAGAGVKVIGLASALPNIVEEVVIDGYSQVGSSPNTLSQGNNAILQIHLDGDGVAGFGDGLAIFAGNCLVRGFAITRFDGSGIYVDSGFEGTNRIQGNFIGLSPGGAAGMGNVLEGIYVASGRGHILGGTLPAEANVVSDNGSIGVSLNSDANVVQGNLIGLDPSGTVALPNASNGISVESDGNLIGGAAGLGGNMVCGHSHAGIILGNLADANQVLGNHLGAGPWGTNRLGNLYGVFVSGTRNWIGSDAPGAGNVVSGNRSHGVFLEGTGAVSNIVSGNIVGRDPSGLLLVSNRLSGVVVEGVGNIIGGSTAGSANLIAGNGFRGVVVRGTAIGTAILGNRIFENAALGIDLGDDDITFNDDGDVDGGPNLSQNYPVLNTVQSGFGAVLSCTLTSAPSQTFRVEFFESAQADLSGYGEGQNFLGTTNVVTGPDGTVGFSFVSPVEIPGGHFVTATATDTANNTSEFSPALRAGLATPVILVNDIMPPGGTVVVTNSATITLVNSNPEGSTYYRIDGVERLYTIPFEVTRSIVISAVAYDATMSQVAQSAPLTLIVEGTPAVTVSPTQIVAPTGRPVAFTALASGSSPLHYQWKRNDLELAGQIDAILDLGPATSEMAGSYTVVVSNHLGVAESTGAMLTVGDAPMLGTGPVGTNVIEEVDVTFCVDATGEAPLRYQWRQNGVNIPGATNDCLTITNATLEDGGSYTVVVANAFGAFTSPPAVLSFMTSNAPGGDDFANRELIMGAFGAVSGNNDGATREVPEEPRHADWPGRHSVWYSWKAPASGIANFSAAGSNFDTLLGIYTGDSLAKLLEVASDEDAIKKSWTSRVGFNAVSNEVYQIALDGFANQSGDYILSWSLEVTNATVPVVTSQPKSISVGMGQGALFSVAASGGVVAYQWYRNDVPIAGANAPSYNVPSVGLGHLGQYKVRLTGTGGRVVESAEASLQIGSMPDVLARSKSDGVPASAYATNAANNLDGQGGFIGGGSGVIPLSAGSIGQQLWNNYGYQNQLEESNHCDIIGGSSSWLVFWTEDSGTMRADTEGGPTNAVLALYASSNPTLVTSSRVLLSCDGGGGSGQAFRRLTLDLEPRHYYFLALDNPDGDHSTNCINWKFDVPPIVLQPVETSILREGQSVELTISNVVGGEVEGIRWFRGTNELYEVTGTNLVLPRLSAREAGVYRVVLTNFAGFTTNTISVLSVVGPGSLEARSTTDQGMLNFKVMGTFPYSLVVEAAPSLPCNPCGPLEGPAAGLQANCVACQDMWTPVWTHCIPNEPFEFVDPEADLWAQRFYRVRVFECEESMPVDSP